MEVDALPTPALVVDADALEQNLATMAAALPGTRCRPHVKAHKTTALARRQRDHGHTAFTCATPREVLGTSPRRRPGHETRPLRRRLRGPRPGQREHAEALWDEVGGVLAPMGLRLSIEKTRVCHIDEGFDFSAGVSKAVLGEDEPDDARSTPTRRRRACSRSWTGCGPLRVVDHIAPSPTCCID